MHRRQRVYHCDVAFARAAYLRVARIVAEQTGIGFADIIQPARAGTCRRRPLRFARQAAIYLTVTQCDVRQGTLARALRRPRVRIVMHCRSAEDARDDLAIDGLFARIEALI